MSNSHDSVSFAQAFSMKSQDKDNTTQGRHQTLIPVGSAKVKEYTEQITIHK